ILIGTSHASLIRFPESTLRPLGRTATGVKGITLREGDEVVGLDVAHANSVDEVLVVTENEDVNVELSARNIPGVQVTTAQGLNVLDITNADSLVITEA
ncbi:50S ribosomal protein L4, partial [Pseudomonas sp. MOB-449]|nr:50S ribosomal protein L4 [Pseudomonas sp. MOB-449]